MKIHSAFGTNINHVQQQRVTTSPTAPASKELSSTKPYETSKSALTHQLLDTNANEGFLQALRQGIKTLEEGLEGMRTLTTKEAFAALQEKMMDVVDNSLYENRSLFHAASSFLLPEGLVEAPSFGFLEALEYADEAGLDEALKHVGTVRSHVEKALFVNQIATFNTLAALSAEAPLANAEKNGIHEVAHLKVRIGALLKDV